MPESPDLRPPSARSRCSWCGGDQTYVAYHDREWGVPIRNSVKLFEALILDSFQAGLSWITVLRKREAFRRVFHGFDPAAVAQFGERDVARLLQDRGIIRHRGKIEAAVAGARAWLRIEEREGFDSFVWSFVDGRPVQNHFRHMDEVPASTPVSGRLSSALREEGFRFVGPVCVYAFMQGAGLVNDHLVDCFRHPEIARLAGHGERE